MHLYEQYLRMKEQISGLENQCKVIAEMIVKNMEASELSSVEVPNIGTIRMAERVTWVFSDAVKAQQGFIKDLQAKEIETGKAQKKVTKYLRTNI